jgi:hypothetical protein
VAQPTPLISNAVTAVPAVATSVDAAPASSALRQSTHEAPHSRDRAVRPKRDRCAGPCDAT